MPISEYIVKQKNEGKALLKKVAAICGYILLFLILCILILALSPELLYLPFFLMSAALVAVTVFITWRFLCVEFEIVIGNGELRATAIYGRSVTRSLLILPIRDAIEIGAYDDDSYQRLCSLSIQKNLICISSLSAPQMYYALYDDGKDRCVIYFETNERGIAILKQQNPTAFRKSQIK